MWTYECSENPDAECKLFSLKMGGEEKKKKKANSSRAYHLRVKAFSSLSIPPFAFGDVFP